MNKVFGAILLIMLAASSTATVTPWGLFTDNAVLQQGISVPVWGMANDGEKVTVKFQGQEVSTTAHNGHWMLRLKPLKAGGPFTMTISGENTIELKNILVGEVWVCSGQSNMAWQVKNTENAQAAIDSSKDPMIRLYTMPWADKFANPKPAWQECNPDTTPTFSAVGYFFGKHLREALKVPIGLINSSVGGTPADAWTSRTALLANPEIKDIVEKPWTRASYLYNGMIAPLQPYAIEGAIWYQGESNAGRAYEYRTLFPAMIECWRDEWGQGDFPFLFVQLAPFGTNAAEPAWAELREAQLLTAQHDPKTAMAVIMDIGEEKNIHPVKKDPVGARLALAARAIAYGQKLVYSGPIYKSMKIEGDKAILSFDWVGSGLVADGDLKGFTIAGEDQKFVPAATQIQGDKVIVSSPEVAKPMAVRYGWANCPDVNLFNQNGLPATPFRTDDFKMITGPE